MFFEKNSEKLKKIETENSGKKFFFSRFQRKSEIFSEFQLNFNRFFIKKIVTATLLQLKTLKKCITKKYFWNSKKTWINYVWIFQNFTSELKNKIFFKKKFIFWTKIFFEKVKFFLTSKNINQKKIMKIFHFPSFRLLTKYQLQNHFSKKKIETVKKVFK